MVTLDHLAVARLRAALTGAMDFLEEEAENRAAAGGTMTDYEREPEELRATLEGCLELVPDCCAACGACPGFIGAECSGDCGWES